jgi:hypothetical protein
LPKSIATLIYFSDNARANLSEQGEVLMKIFRVFCACIAIAFSTPSWAAKFHLDAQVVEAFSADGLFTPIPLPDYTRPVGFPAVYKIDYSIVANLAELSSTDRGFGAVGFSIDQSQGVTDAFGIGWNPYNPTLDINGNLLGGLVPLFFTNVDAGPSGSDLYGILVGAGPTRLFDWPTDPRSQIALSGPQLIGSTYLLWDGVNTGTSTLGIAFSGIFKQRGVVEGSVSGANGILYYSNFSATTLYFGNEPLLSNPEPTSAILLLGMSIPIALRRTKNYRSPGW